MNDWIFLRAGQPPTLSDALFGFAISVLTRDSLRERIAAEYHRDPAQNPLPIRAGASPGVARTS